MRAVLALERAAVPCLYLDRGPAHVHGSCSGRVESAARMERRSRMGWDATVHEPVPSAGQLPPAHGTSGAAIKRKTTTNGTRTAWQLAAAHSVAAHSGAPALLLEMPPRRPASVMTLDVKGGRADVLVQVPRLDGDGGPLVLVPVTAL